MRESTRTCYEWTGRKGCEGLLDRGVVGNQGAEKCAVSGNVVGVEPRGP